MLEAVRAVKAKDRRIEELEDLVQDLAAYVPADCPCGGNRYVSDTSTWPHRRYVPHAVDCPIPRAERALRRTT